MRAINYTRRFKRDYRREQSGALGKKLDALLMETVNLLAVDAPLPARYVDHPLAGEWTDHRDCHVRPDLVLIYRKPDPDTLELVRLGSHSELGCKSAPEFDPPAINLFKAVQRRSASGPHAETQPLQRFRRRTAMQPLPRRQDDRLRIDVALPPP
jgi:mRNA interferase YafQ